MVKYVEEFITVTVYEHEKKIENIFMQMISRLTFEQVTEYIYNLVTCHISLWTLISMTISGTLFYIIMDKWRF